MWHGEQSSSSLRAEPMLEAQGCSSVSARASLSLPTEMCVGADGLPWRGRERWWWFSFAEEEGEAK